MMTLIMHLEPIREFKHQIIINENEEMNQVTFITHGKVALGYEINKQKRYCLQFHNKCVIGAYEISFFKRSEYVYAALS